MSGQPCRTDWPATIVNELRQSEVHDLRAGFGEHDVAGLEVPVHDTLSMRLVEGVGQLNGDLQRLIQRQGMPPQPLRQRFPFQEFHDEIIDPVLPADIEYGTDVRMAQRRQGPGFSFEPGFSDRADCQREWSEF